MMLNPGQINPTQGAFGGFGSWANPGQPGIGFGPAMAAYGTAGQAFGAPGYGQPYMGFGATGASAIDDIAGDIAERVASEITDQAATGAAALFHGQVPQAAGQPLGGLNVKRWLNATRVTDAAHESVKQGAHQLCRQAVGQLLGVLQSQWAGGGQQQFGQQQFGQQQFGQPFGTLGAGAPALAAAYGAGQPFGQANVAQLAPVVAAILGALQSHGPGLGQAPFGQPQVGMPGRLI
jgi:hypothetical protein